MLSKARKHQLLGPLIKIYEKLVAEGKLEDIQKNV